MIVDVVQARCQAGSHAANLQSPRAYMPTLSSPASRSLLQFRKRLQASNHILRQQMHVTLQIEMAHRSGAE